MVASTQVQARQPPEHREVEPGQRERLDAGVHRLVDATFLFEEHGALGLQRCGPLRSALARFLLQQLDALAGRDRSQGEQRIARRGRAGIDSPRLAQQRRGSHVVARGPRQLAGLDQEIRRVGAGSRVGARLQRLRELGEVPQLEGERAPGLQAPRADQAARHLRRPARQGNAPLRLRLADHRGGAGEQLGSDGARKLGGRVLEEVGELVSGHQARQRARQEPEGGKMSGRELQRALGEGGGLGAAAGALVPDSRLEIVGGSFFRRMRFQRLAERDEPFGGGARIALCHQSRVVRDGRCVSRIVGQRLRQELLLLERVGEQQRRANLEVRALARLDAPLGALAEDVREVGRFLLLGELAAQREQGAVAAMVLERGSGFGEPFGDAAEPVRREGRGQ